MEKDDAIKSLTKIIEKYLDKDPKKIRLISIINDLSRPGLPVRAVLQHLRQYKYIDYTESDKKVLDELIYLYG